MMDGEVDDPTLPYPGVVVMLARRRLVMPALSAGAARRHWARMLAAQSGDEPDPVGLAASVAHACLARNYPDITTEAVEDGVDFENFGGFLAAAMGRGSFRRWAQAQAAAAGNASPQQQTPAGTGGPSTPASPPPQDGAPGTSTT